MLYTLGLSLPSMGATKYPFGTCLITSLGAIGIENTFGPHNYVSRCPIVVSINKVVKKPWVVDN